MNSYIKKAVCCLLRPLQGGGSFFIFTYVLLLLVLLPVWFFARSTAKVDLWTFVEAFADVYLLAWLLSLLPKHLRQGLQALTVTTLFVFSVVDYFAKVHFHSFINSAMVRLVMETRSNEVGNFFTSYVFQPTTLLLLLPFVAWGLAWYYYVHRWEQLRHLLGWLPQNKIKYAVLAIVVLGESVSLPVKIKTIDVLQSPTVSDLEVKYGDLPSLSLYSSVHRVLLALRSIQLVDRQVISVREVQKNLLAHRSDQAVPKVVVVIGESYNRAHSQLYGYHLETTPRQKAREESGQLFRFTDVISCWNLTSYVFQNLFSLHSIDSKDGWENYPLFPAIYKKAGYHVAFLSNQYPASTTGTLSSFSGSFFMNDPVLSKQLFDYHNTVVQLPFDDANLLKEYDGLRVDSTYEMVIFSLLGMHFNYDERIPSDKWKKFDESLYVSKNLSKEDRQILADYDNATYYNDVVMEEIIRYFEKENAVVIYCPDHGEELFDGTGVWGRTYPAVMSDAELHNQFEIPFWIWCSERFFVSHPEMIDRLQQAKDLPFMTDDLPHLLMQLTGVSSKAYDASRSPLSDTYNAKRKRVVRGWQEYKW